MEKNIYDIIQDWYELVKNGTINEDEFSVKKNELLKIEKIKSEELEKQKINEDFEFKNSRKFFDNTMYYYLSIAGMAILALYFYNRNYNSELIENDGETIEFTETYAGIGNYIVQADESNLVHFYKEPDISTEKKSYFSTKDTVYVSKIENGFGYVSFLNSNGKKSIGWLQLENIIYCTECLN